MSMDDFVRREAVNSLEGLADRVSNLEDNDYYVPVSKAGSTSNPPTQAQLNSILNEARTYNSNTLALLRDVSNGRYWMCFGDKEDNRWYFVPAQT